MNLIKFIKQNQADVILTIAVALISITSFNLGKISANQQKKIPITITQPESTDSLNTKPSTLNAASVVASKASKSKVYHFPWCAGASNIAEKNKITFASEVAAISANYTLASNCQK